MNFGRLNGVGPAISGENVAFGGHFGGGSGYYASIDGTIVVLADSKMTIPGTEETFAFFPFEGSDPAISGRRVAFQARSSFPGTDDVTFRNVGTPEGASPSFSGKNVVFAGSSPSSTYTHVDGILQRVMDTSMTGPGHDDVPFLNFGFREPGIGGTNIAFSGGGVVTKGVYVLITDPPPVPGQSQWSVMDVTLLLLAAASAIIVRHFLSPARRAL